MEVLKIWFKKFSEMEGKWRNAMVKSSDSPWGLVYRHTRANLVLLCRPWCLVDPVYKTTEERITRADPGFWSGGASGVLTQFAQHWGFPLKLPENCMIKKKSWGQGGTGPWDLPWIRQWIYQLQRRQNANANVTVDKVACHVKLQDSHSELKTYSDLLAHLACPLG